MTGTLSMTNTNQDDKDVNNNLGKIIADDLVGDTDTQLAMAQQIDTFARNLNALTTHAYKDTTVKINISINDIVAGE